VVDQLVLAGVIAEQQQTIHMNEMGLSSVYEKEKAVKKRMIRRKKHELCIRGIGKGRGEK
jgi:uncharacterized coiled-coil protein SlyX